MKAIIIKTSPKHYAEKKMRLAPKATSVRFNIVNLPDAYYNAGESVSILRAAKCKNHFFWDMNNYKNINQLPPAKLAFVQKWIALDWGLDLNIEHDFNVMRKIFINSIINN